MDKFQDFRQAADSIHQFIHQFDADSDKLR